VLKEKSGHEIWDSGSVSVGSPVHNPLCFAVKSLLQYARLSRCMLIYALNSPGAFMQPGSSIILVWRHAPKKKNGNQVDAISGQSSIW
jgi:hypothetical protein